MKARKFRAVLWGVCLAAGCAWTQDGSGNTRYLTDKPGFWQPQKYLGEHVAGATATEAQEITTNLKRTQAVLLATSIGTNPVGFCCLSAPMWPSRGRSVPIRQGLGIRGIHRRAGAPSHSRRHEPARQSVGQRALREPYEDA